MTQTKATTINQQQQIVLSKLQATTVLTNMQPWYTRALSVRKSWKQEKAILFPGIQ
ncbi:hypothetical protein H6G97_44215 [Nostoc flagelliforme FACHB-838]|uniref:Transposase n=1 Tax=Nostoc flagelliforme FACHB-838 TaxID=2692904 RepID=A0ABR8E2N4_9NOSO|nr:hypothetical protein [Nostoc flagelliforme FACHB-838]